MSSIIQMSLTQVSLMLFHFLSQMPVFLVGDAEPEPEVYAEQPIKLLVWRHPNMFLVTLVNFF